MMLVLAKADLKFNLSTLESRGNFLQIYLLEKHNHLLIRLP